MANNGAGFWRGLFTSGGAPIPEPAPATYSMPEGVMPPSRAADPLSVDGSLGLTSVYRGVQILSTTCAQLTIGTWRGDQEILPTPSVVAQPDLDRPLSSFLKRTVTNLALHGNAYWLVTRNGRGEVSSLRALDPNRVAVRFDERGVKSYDVTGSDLKSRNYDDKTVQHLRLLEVPGQAYGLGPIQAGRAGLTAAKRVEDYAENWFDKGGVPTGTLNTDQHLAPEQSAATLDAWNAMLRESKTAILPRGVTYHPIFLNPADAQWLESKQFSVTEIARLFGIPAAYLLAEVNGSSMTYSNISQLNTVFHQTTLMSYLSEIEDALTLLLPRGQRAEFKTDRLLRVDDQARATYYATSIASGVLTRDEARAREGLPPLGEPAPAPKTPGAALDEALSAKAEEAA